VALLGCDWSTCTQELYLITRLEWTKNELKLGSWVYNRSSNCCAWNIVKCSNSLRDAHLINGSLFSPFEGLSTSTCLAKDIKVRLTKVSLAKVSFSFLLHHSNSFFNFKF